MRLFALSLAVAVAACGNDESDSTESATDSLAPYQGAWVSACENSAKPISRLTAVVVGSERTVTQMLYSDNACLLSHLSTTIVMNMEIVGDSETVAGAQKVNYTLTASTAKMLSEEMVAFANANSLFDYNDWQIDVPKDVGGRAYDKESEALDSIGAVMHTIVKVAAETWTPGNTDIKSGATEADRPDSLDPALVLTKQ